MDIKYEGLWTLRCYDKKGNLKWEDVDLHNALADEGEQNMLDQYFRNQNAPSTFYARLCNDTPIETDALSDIQNEPSGMGYSAQEIERSAVGFPTLALDSGDYQLTSKQVTFECTGSGNSYTVTYAYLATTSNDTGKLVAFVALSQSRTLNTGDNLKLTVKIKLQ